MIEGITRTAAGRAGQRIQALLQCREPAALHSRRVGDTILSGDSCSWSRNERKHARYSYHCDHLREQSHFLSFPRNREW
jgi:hypothetical protein